MRAFFVGDGPSSPLAWGAVEVGRDPSEIRTSDGALGRLSWDWVGRNGVEVLGVVVASASRSERLRLRDEVGVGDRADGDIAYGEGWEYPVKYGG